MIATNQPEVVALQYQTSANLDARMRLHLLYSTNHDGWLRWVFEHPHQAREKAAPLSRRIPDRFGAAVVTQKLLAAIDHA